jgi:transposase-like protein
MYIQGVSTRKVKTITEELCGHEFSASAISAINKRLDEELHRFMHRSLEEEFPYLILDARYEKVREDGVIRSRAVLVALGVDWEGRRQVLGVELANRESATSWKEFCSAPHFFVGAGVKVFRRKRDIWSRCFVGRRTDKRGKLWHISLRSRTVAT